MLKYEILFEVTFIEALAMIGAKNNALDDGPD